jgi:hypothetical protein
MRKIACYDIHGLTVEGILDEFNQRRVEEFGIADDDVISMSVREATAPFNIHTPDEGKKSKVVVTIFYWVHE